MGSLEALLFDVDGTLADTEREGHRIAFNAAFRDAGLDWDWDEAMYGTLLGVTGGKERIHYYLQGYRADFEPPGGVNSFISALHASKTEHYKRLMADGRIPLRTGIRRLFSEARSQGIWLGIATTTTVDNVHGLLDSALETNGAAWFEVVAAGDVVPAKKPAPDIYLWAMERLGLPPDRCLALEDSHNGLLSALGAGIRSVVITVNGYTREEDLTGASLVVDHLGDPGNPCHALFGGPAGGDMVDVALLRQVHRQAIGD
jgi:beta-phosphoglucomutase-like phosphatase (HAD superfamily)